jgi:hypothetical protein
VKAANRGRRSNGGKNRAIIAASRFDIIYIMRKCRYQEMLIFGSGFSEVHRNIPIFTAKGQK